MPGSHRGEIAIREDARDRSEVGDALEIADVDTSAAFTVTLEPGDATFHHCRTNHYAGGNRAGDPRRGLITHFFPGPELEARPLGT